MAKFHTFRKYRLVLSQVFLGVILGSLAIFSMLVSPILILESATILKTLIEIDTAMLGFWGIILAYALTSLDSRRDSLERQKFEITKIMAQAGGIRFSQALKLAMDDEHVNFIETRIRELTKAFNKMRKDGIINSAMFMVSIASSIVGLGIPKDIISLYFLTTASLYYFVTGAAFIFLSLWELRAE